MTGTDLRWRRISPDTIGAEGYLITRCEVNGQAHFAAWSPERGTPLLSYWGETADRARAACNEHRARIYREGRGSA